MGLLSKALIAGQFKVGTYAARQIIRIEKGGLVISCSDSRYQPDAGVRYEISPDEWFLYTYIFFPVGCAREDAYDEAFLTREVYYDYYAKSGPESPGSMADRKYIYAIFKNDQDTGYRIIESSKAINRGSYWHSAGSTYEGLFINSWGLSSYPTSSSYPVKPFYGAKSIVEAAIYLLADANTLVKVKVSLAELIKESESARPGTIQLCAKLQQLLKACMHTNLYLHDK